MASCLVYLGARLVRIMRQLLYRLLWTERTEPHQMLQHGQALIVEKTQSQRRFRVWIGGGAVKTDFAFARLRAQSLSRGDALNGA